MFAAKTRSLVLAAVVGLLTVSTAQDCNPTTATCPAIPGIPTADYSVDFTQTTTLPAGWTLADYANVTFGSNGAEFTLHKQHEAPYIWTDYMFFGSVEMVAQAAPGQGIISSAVLLSDDLDEIDWEFSGNNFGYPSGRVQTNYFGKGITAAYDRGTLPEVASPPAGFHTYKIDWTPTTLTWSIDGSVIRILSAADGNNYDHQYPQTPSRFHLGLWAGGDPENAPGTIQWAGGLTDFTQAPFTFYVKSVSISNMNPCSSYIYTDKTGSAASVECVNGNTTTFFNASPTMSSITGSITDTVQSTVPTGAASGTSASSSSAASSVTTNTATPFPSTTVTLTLLPVTSTGSVSTTEAPAPPMATVTESCTDSMSMSAMYSNATASWTTTGETSSVESVPETASPSSFITPGSKIPTFTPAPLTSPPAPPAPAPVSSTSASTSTTTTETETFTEPNATPTASPFPPTSPLATSSTAAIAPPPTGTADATTTAPFAISTGGAGRIRSHITILGVVAAWIMFS